VQTTRRNFLKVSLGAPALLAFGNAIPLLSARQAKAAPDQGNDRESVLVVIQLSGGNDGLNTVVPYEVDAYHRNRPTLRLSKDRVLKIERSLGFHPDMPAFLRLYEEGHLAIIQGVGYPNSSRDHDRAKQDWHTARPKETVPQTGWLGRTIDQACASGAADAPGLFVGEIQTPFGLHAERAVVPSIHSPREWIFSKEEARAGVTLQRLIEQSGKTGQRNGSSPLLDFLRSATVNACSATSKIQAVLDAGTASSKGYPDFPLAEDLKSIAQLIRARLGIRIYLAEQGGGQIGGFDTHAGQAINHGALLRELSESIAAFVTDLRGDGLLESVLVMTFSEFGRTLSENGRRGTDHGAAAPVFVAGAKFKSRLLGTHPSLTDLDGDAPKFHTDFRRLYSTVLDRWLGYDSRAVLGKSFAPIEGLMA